MVTLVGTQKDFIRAIKELIELDYDAVDAYKAAVNNLGSDLYKRKLKEFQTDHERHIKELSAFLKSKEEEAPQGPDATKGLLSKGKVYLASLKDDESILKAMLSNENDTNTAYERMYTRSKKEADEDLYKIIETGFQDEKRHKEWMESILIPPSAA